MHSLHLLLKLFFFFTIFLFDRKRFNERRENAKIHTCPFDCLVRTDIVDRVTAEINFCPNKLLCVYWSLPLLATHTQTQTHSSTRSKWFVLLHPNEKHMIFCQRKYYNTYECLSLSLSELVVCNKMPYAFPLPWLRTDQSVVYVVHILDSVDDNNGILHMTMHINHHPCTK